MRSSRIRMMVRILGLLFIFGAIMVFLAELVYLGICFLIVSIMIIIRSFSIREDMTWESIWNSPR
ncbi:MAG: hypothetical protein ACTSX2_05355 [Candidatus Thorarchaeota archaeon]